MSRAGSGSAEGNLSEKRLLPLAVRRAWIQFVVRPKLWQCLAMTVVMALLSHGWLKVVEFLVIFRDGYSIWWPTDGVLLGLLLTTRRRHWGWIIVGFVIGNQTTDLTSLPNTLCDASCNVLEAVLPALTLPHFRSMNKWLAQPGVTLRFLLLAMIAAPLASSLVSPIFYAGPAQSTYWSSVQRWFGADLLGVALATPLFLTLLSPETWLLFRPPELPKTIGLIALMIALSSVTFHQNMFPISFLAYPVILLMGTQMGLSGAAIGINILAVMATLATVRGQGPFGAGQGDHPTVLSAVLQGYLVVGISMTMPTCVARVRRLTTEAKLKQAWAAMKALATKDGLTGVANRREFDTSLAAEWSRAARQRSHLALLLIDADHFKAFNDNYGHLAGDACLRDVAQAISQVPRRPTDLVARYGGEEFVVLLPGTDAAGALMIAEEVRRAAQCLAIPHLFNEEQGRVTVSIGAVSVVPNGKMESVSLIAAADKALYEAKRNGRNRVVFDDSVLTLAVAV